MATGQPRFTDPDHVRETLCTGPCWTSGYTNDTMQIVLTATRHDVAMISEGRFTQPPDYVVVARIVMTTNRTASQNATHVSFVSTCTVRASWEHPCDRDHQLMMERGDRVGNVALGSERRRRGVGNYREWQVF